MIYIDTPRPTKYKKFKRTCHMMTDDNIGALHYFAGLIGLKREWFQDNPLHPHYDLFDNRISAALAAGANLVDTKTMVRHCSKLFGLPMFSAGEVK